VSSSLIDGITFGTSPHRSAASVRSWMTRPLRPAMAMTSTVAPVLEAAWASWSRPPSTGTPLIRSRRLAGSSSRMATGRYGAPGWVASRAINWTPAAPAPNTMILTAVGAAGRDRSRAAKATYRAPSIATTANAAPPSTVASSAPCPASSSGPAAARPHAVRKPASATAATSSRLPLRYRPR
jgi:hypothetical protein